MRTKTLLLTAALSAAGIATSMAQTVYSVNAVGYVNVVLPAGFSIVANPLVATPNNNVTNIFQAPLDGMTVYKFTGTGYQTTAYDELFAEWSDKTVILDPGMGAFVKVPTGKKYTNTFVGSVDAGPAGSGSNGGTKLTNSIPSGFSLKSSRIPQAGKLTTDLKYTPGDGDAVYQFDSSTQKYKATASFDGLFNEWAPAEPNVAVAEGFWIKIPAGQTRQWVRDFTIQN